MTAQTKIERIDRVEIVNEIIKAIALNGRGFFLNKRDNDIAYIFQKNGKLYMHNEYDKSKIYLHTKYGYPPHGFNHGGTMWALTKDFKEFIINGGHTNNNNGYGGLYCPHWGYDESSMKVVRETASRLGYLEPISNT